MKGSGLDVYLAVGRSALRNILISCAACKVRNVLSVLDFASGAGRVTRWLRAAFPDAELVVSDINKSFVEFCAETFAAVPHISHANFTAVTLPGTYDLIWSGSLLTHLPESQAVAALELMYRSLNPNGVMVITTHGRKVMRNQLLGRAQYIDGQQFNNILMQAMSRGYGYAPHGPGRLGISLNTLGWLGGWCARSPDRRIVHFAEKGWHDHQDVVAVAKSPI
jgi:SAM-dependent methyltransferase